MNDAFFAGIEQLELEVDGMRGRIPCFYRNARCFSLIAPAKLSALRSFLPDRRFTPARLFPGVGLVHLSAFEYHDSDIGPYNEFAFGILLDSPDFGGVFAYNPVRQLFRGDFHTFIVRLAVTTEVAMRAGIDLYNYPKFIAGIDFSDTDKEIACRLEENGELICQIRGARLPAPKTGMMRYLCHLYQFQQPQSAEFKVNAESYAMTLGPGNGHLELGEKHPVARELRSVLLTGTPLLYFYVPHLQAILFGPEHLSLASIGLFLERGWLIHRGQTHASAKPKAAMDGGADVNLIQ